MAAKQKLVKSKFSRACSWPSIQMPPPLPLTYPSYRFPHFSLLSQIFFLSLTQYFSLSLSLSVCVVLRSLLLLALLLVLLLAFAFEDRRSLQFRLLLRFASGFFISVSALFCMLDNDCSIINHQYRRLLQYIYIYLLVSFRSIFLLIEAYSAGFLFCFVVAALLRVELGYFCCLFVLLWIGVWLI